MTESARSYYCSYKFKYLKIDLESKTTYNCHAAQPHDVDFKWLNSNPGQLFNTDINVSERRMMLANQRNSSCEQNCWRAEDVGAISPRLYQHGAEQTHTDVVSTPEIIDLTIGGDCNLTCSYCCKEYSSAWRRDIIANGNYNVSSDRYTGTVKDKILLNVSQKELNNTKQYNQLLDEIMLVAPGLKKLIVTGGEPLLDNTLISTLKNTPLSNNAVIDIYSGLGIGLTRFKNILPSLQAIKNLTFIISAECIEELFEFNRYGNRWTDFLEKVELLKEHNINIQFGSTISNLTIFGFPKFYQFFKDTKISVTFAYQPSFMAPYILDEESKLSVLNSIENLPDNIKTQISQSIAGNPTLQNYNELKVFLKEFINSRPGLSTNIFPTSFKNWVSAE